MRNSQDKSDLPASDDLKFPEISYWPQSPICQLTKHSLMWSEEIFSDYREYSYGWNNHLGEICLKIPKIRN